MVIVLNALGLPPEDISLVFIIDWLVDRIRTPINVLGDAFGSAVVEHLSRNDLHLLEQNDPTPIGINSKQLNGGTSNSAPISMAETPRPTIHIENKNYANQAFDGEFDEKL